MFTGIVEKLGAVRRVERRGRALRLRIAAPGFRLKPGESVAVEGVCLTAIQPGRGSFSADLSAETLSRTTLGSLAPGSHVNLERPLRLSDRLGGHFVLGHVDVRGAVDALVRDRQGARLVVRFPLRYHALVVEKGSVAVNGVSLTVAAEQPGRFEVALIPHTLAVTSLGAAAAGDQVNLEFDYLAKLVLGGLARRAVGRGKRRRS